MIFLPTEKALTSEHDNQYQQQCQKPMMKLKTEITVIYKSVYL